jgi:16S rRNA (guanine527-N7)-methyltransferase
MPGADRLLAVLDRARTIGFLGPGPVEPHVEHARAFASLLDLSRMGPFVDLGSGGGVPGLVLATLLPETSWVLVDSMVRRTAFLEDAVERLGLAGRVQVVTARAEEIGRDRAHRGTYPTVVARSFGAPPVLAECAAPLLVRGGTVVVSEPPAPDQADGPRPGRWPAAGLALVGLALDRWDPGPPSLVRLRLTDRCPRTYPRQTGVPTRQPLWVVPGSV